MRAAINARCRWLFLVFLACLPPSSDRLAVSADGPPADKLSAVLVGKVVGVHDADTLTLLVGKQQYKVRFAGIDAPELGQDYGRKAKQALSEKLFGKTVRVETAGTDRYSRVLGTVWLAAGPLDRSVNHELVAEGWAWHYSRYSNSQELADAEAAARETKLGLWADPNPVAPWDWRKLKKQRDQKTDGESTPKQPTPADPESSTQPPDNAEKFWLNTSTGVRHNSTCKNFGKTKRGRNCTKNEGRPCGICGG